MDTLQGDSTDTDQLSFIHQSCPPELSTRVQWIVNRAARQSRNYMSSNVPIVAFKSATGAWTQQQSCIHEDVDNSSLGIMAEQHCIIIISK